MTTARPAQQPVTPDTPDISVVIITFNQEDYIAQTIESALSQVCRFRFEIVIGEDCSTDSTRSIVEEYHRRHPEIINLLPSTRNLGLLDNYYRTVSAARGALIAGCAGDDYWHDPLKLQKQAEFLSENADYGLVHTDVDYFYQESGYRVRNVRAKSANPPPLTSSLDDILLGRSPIVAPTAMFRKSLFDAHFDLQELRANGIIMEDTPLWTEIAAHSKIGYIPESTITHREILGTISNPGTYEKRLRFIDSSEKCLKHYTEKYKDRLSDYELVRNSIDRRMGIARLQAAFSSAKPGEVRQRYRKIREQYGAECLSRLQRRQYLLACIPFGITAFNCIRERWHYAKTSFASRGSANQ